MSFDEIFDLSIAPLYWDIYNTNVYTTFTLMYLARYSLACARCLSEIAGDVLMFWVTVRR